MYKMFSLRILGIASLSLASFATVAQNQLSDNVENKSAQILAADSVAQTVQNDEITRSTHSPSGTDSQETGPESPKVGGIEPQTLPMTPQGDIAKPNGASSEDSGQQVSSTEAEAPSSEVSAAVVVPQEYQPLTVVVEGKPSRYAFVAKLIELSSGAKQVQNSSNPEAIVSYQEARSFFVKATDSEDIDQINMFLNMAVGKMYNAIRLSTVTSFGDEKAKRDYEQRLKSVDALSDAYIRIAEEKDAQAKSKIVLDQIEKHKVKAENFGKNNKYAAGREELDQSYSLLKSAIELLRGGDTLTRSLNFANAEEEFHYEKDRNDTHFMLVNLLVNSKLESKPQAFKDKIFKMVDDASLLQENANASAAKGRHKEAIVLLEQSTSILVKAIRMGGVFIPSA